MLNYNQLLEQYKEKALSCLDDYDFKTVEEKENFLKKSNILFHYQGAKIDENELNYDNAPEYDPYQEILPGLYLTPVFHIFTSKEALENYAESNSITPSFAYTIATFCLNKKEMKDTLEGGKNYSEALAISKIIRSPAGEWWPLLNFYELNDEQQHILQESCEDAELEGPYLVTGELIFPLSDFTSIEEDSDLISLGWNGSMGQTNNSSLLIQLDNERENFRYRFV